MARRSQNDENNSALARAQNHKTGIDPAHFKLPDNVFLWDEKNTDAPINLEFLNYRIPKTSKSGPNPYAKPGKMHYERTVWVHKGIGPERTSYTCLQKTIGKKCPVCEYITKQKSGGLSKEEFKALSNLFPKERQLFNLIDHRQKKKGVQVWDFSYHLFGKMLDKIIHDADTRDGWHKFADPKDGFTLRVGFEDKNFQGKPYKECSSIIFRERQGTIPARLTKAVQCLDDLIVILPYNELKEIFLQTAIDSDDESDDFESPRRRRSKPDNDDEGFDTDLTDDDDNDIDDDDWSVFGDDEDEDEDEDEPTPKRKKKSRPRRSSTKSKKSTKPDNDDNDDDDYDTNDDWDTSWDDD